MLKSTFPLHLRSQLHICFLPHVYKQIPCPRSHAFLSINQIYKSANYGRSWIAWDCSTSDRNRFVSLLTQHHFHIASVLVLSENSGPSLTAILSESHAPSLLHPAHKRTLFSEFLMDTDKYVHEQ